MNTDRSTRSGWLNYMEQNPFYFSGVFGKEYNPLNVEFIEKQIFNGTNSVREFADEENIRRALNRKYRRAQKRADKVMGMVAIAKYLGVSKNRAIYLRDHGGLPGERCSREWGVYEKVLDNWAKRKKIGRFA